MAASTITLALNPGASNETSITINGPAGPTSPELLPEWVSELTADLTRVVYRAVNNEVWRWQMNIPSLTTAMKNSLVTFYRDNAEGPTNTWRLTYTDAVNYTVRFVEVPRMQRLNDNEWSAELVLELDGSLNS